MNRRIYRSIIDTNKATVISIAAKIKFLILKKFIAILLPLLATAFGTAHVHAQTMERRFEPYQLRADIDVLKQAFTTLHPGLYRYNSPRAVDSLFAVLYAAAKRPLGEKAFYLLLARFAAQIRCGHTYLNPLNLEENVLFQYMPKEVFPFCTRLLERRLVITHNLTGDSTIARGFEIVAINGIAIERVVDSLLLVSRADGKNGLPKMLSNLEILPAKTGQYTLFDIFFPLFFGVRSSGFVITFLDNNNQKVSKVIKGISPAERSKQFATRFEPVPRGAKALKAQLLNDSTCYLSIGTFSFWGADDPFAKFTDSVFSALQQNPRIKYLILDLRKNEGGSGAARDRLLSYILPRNFSAKEYSERRFFSYLTVPENLLPFLGKIDDAGFAPKADTIFTRNEFGFFEDQKSRAKGSRNFSDFAINEKRFGGQVFLMTSPVNSSAGFEFAWVFQQYQAGVIVGEPTGGTKQGLNGGNFFFLRLPYSRIEIDLPFIYQAHPGQPDSGVIPDVIISQTREAVIQNKDAQLDAVLKLINRGR
jgi:hypothetical protein